MSPRFSSATAGALLLLVALTACAAPSDPAASPAPAASASTEPTEQPVASPEPAESDDPLTCETMISKGTVEALTDAGWTAKATEFRIGEVELTAGLLCFWGDYTVGSDHGQLYGWSEITADDARKAQATLLDGGWTREDGPAGTYFTEDPQYSMGTDDEGYGMTYLFNDGWVKLADTKQSLLLIGWAG